MKIERILALSNQGYSMLDKKRVILINEIMNLVGEAEDIQHQIDLTYQEAYAALEQANIEAGIRYVEEIAATVPIENSLKLKVRSVMGTEIPLVEFDESPSKPTYSFFSTNSSLDEARVAFEKVKELSKIVMVNALEEKESEEFTRLKVVKEKIIR